MVIIDNLKIDYNDPHIHVHMPRNCTVLTYKPHPNTVGQFMESKMLLNKMAECVSSQSKREAVQL